jgi:hypothetical protein
MHEYHAEPRRPLRPAEFCARHRLPIYLLTDALDRGVVVREGDGLRWVGFLERYFTIRDEPAPSR